MPAADARTVPPLPAPRGRARRIAWSAALWIAAAAVTIACFGWQDRTGPTYPLGGVIDTDRGEVSFHFQRSETIGRDLAVLLVDPVPEGVTGVVEYRRFRSHDDWTTTTLAPGRFETSRRGRIETFSGVGAALPTLRERAGKYEYLVRIDDGDGEPFSITGERPVVARYKADVPRLALVLHILAIFASMTVAVRTTLQAIVGRPTGRLVAATILTLLLGGFFLGPLVQWHAFGVWWSGIPFGTDWTDNKVVVEIAFWLLAALPFLGVRSRRAAVILAGVATLAVYFIPHSIHGSEYDYTQGRGMGTADRAEPPGETAP